MKKAILFLFTVNCLAQAPTIQWQKTFGGTGTDYGNSFIQTTDGGYIFTGNTFSSNGDVTLNNGASDTWVVKTDAIGTILWQKTYGGSNNDLANSIKQTTDGGYILAGLSNSTNGDVTANYGDNDFWVLKIDSNGTKQWDKSFGGSSNDFAFDIKQTSDGGYIVSGTSSSNDFNSINNHGDYDALVVKLDSSGNLSWQKSYGGSDMDQGGYAEQTSDGGYIMTLFTRSINGNVTNNHGGFDAWVVKTDANGNIIWQKTYGGTFTDSLNKVQFTPDGGYLFLGATNSNNGDITIAHGNDDIWVVKTDAVGNILWQKTFGGSNADNSTEIKPTNDGYIIGGSTKSTDFDVTLNRGLFDYWLFKINNTGDLIWQKTFGGSGNDNLTDFILTNDNGFVLLGRSNSSDYDVTSNHGETDFWVVKLFPETLSNPVSRQNVLSIYPNPTNSLLNIQFESNIIIDKITITDLSGKTIVVQSQNNQINIENLSSGIYFIQAFSNENIYTAKFIKE